MSENTIQLMHTYPYHLVEFINIGRKPKIKKIDIVLSKWIEYNESRKKLVVKYPPPPYNDETSNAYNNLLTSFSDSLDNWPSYSIKIKGRAKNLNEAYAKCQELNDKETALTLGSDNDMELAEQRAMNEIRQSKLKEISDNMKQSISNAISDNEFNENKKSNNKKQNKTKLENFCTLQTTPQTSNKDDRRDDNLKFPHNMWHNQKTENEKLKNITNNYTYQKLSSNNSYKDLHKDLKLENKVDAVYEQSIIVTNEVKHIKYDLEFLKNEIQQLKAMQQKIAGVGESDYCASIAQLQEKYAYNIPFNTIEEFQEFDYQLKLNEALSKDVCTVLQTGVDAAVIISKCLVNMLKMFVQKSVAMQYVAVKKIKNKFVMRNTNFYNKMEVIIKRRREMVGLSCCDKELITALSNVLSNSVSWYKTGINQIQDENISTAPASNILATGTIENGVLKIDKVNSNVDWQFLETTEDKNQASDSEENDFGDYYLQHFSK